MGITPAQSKYLQFCYAWLQKQKGIRIIPHDVAPQALNCVQNMEDGYSKDLNLTRNYAKEAFVCDVRELVQNFRDQCTELSSTHHIALFADQAAEQQMQQAAAQAGLQPTGLLRTYFLVEDLTPQHPQAAAGAAGTSAATPSAKTTTTAAAAAAGPVPARPPYVLGHIVEYLDESGRRSLDLCNHCTLLNPDMFAMGGTTKASKPYTAGHWGEGMKVQINRLIVERQLEVSYTTGPCCWSFTHSCSPHCQQPTLHLHSTKLTQHHAHPCLDPAKSEETICSIAGFMGSDQTLDSSLYLFLQPPLSQLPVHPSSPAMPAYMRSSSTPLLLRSLGAWFKSVVVSDKAAGGEFGVEFLFAPHLHGKLFLHGILLLEEPDLVGLGINFTCSTRFAVCFSLTRDRKTANVPYMLCWLFPKAISMLSHKSSQDPGQAACLLCVLAHLHQAMSVTPTIFSKLQHQVYDWKEYKLMAQLLTQLLGPSVGLAANCRPSPFPCSERASSLEAAELSLLGLQPVKASDLLLAVWKKAGELRSLEELWQDRRLEVGSMQDATLTWGQVARAEAEAVLDNLAGLLVRVAPMLDLPPTAAAWRSSMKVLNLVSEQCYHEHVVIPFKAAAGRGPLLVYEAEYLKSLDAVHRRMAATGDSCTAAGNSCGGQCISDLLLHETIAALDKMGLDQKIVNKRVMSQVLSMTGPQVKLLGTQAARTAHKNNSCAVEHAGMDGTGSVQLASLAPFLGNTSAAAGHATTLAGHSLCNSSCSTASGAAAARTAVSVGAGPVNNYAAPASIAHSVASSLFAAAGATAPQQIAGCAAGSAFDNASQQQLEAHCREDKALAVTGFQLGSAADGSATASSFLYLPQGAAHTITQAEAEAARQLYGWLFVLLRDVFGGAAAAAAAGCGAVGVGAVPQFFVYWDPARSTIAFNRAGQLWFNAATTPNLSGVANARFGCLRFWFLSCCHELAHNQVREHNSAFSDACSAIVLQFAGRFMQFAEDHCGSGQCC